jgi:hypothetical protein
MIDIYKREEKKMKREVAIYGIILIILFILLVIPAVSAGFSDWINGITGKATSSTTTANITVGNTPPTIGFVVNISNITPTENGVKKFVVYINATDADGVANLNATAVRLYVQNPGEDTRSNESCLKDTNIDATMANYSCTVGIYYYDEAADWIINVTVQDINGAIGVNDTSNFTIISLNAVTMSPTSLTWNSLAVTDSNTGSNNDPIVINNTGNTNHTTLTGINVTAINLWGEESSSLALYASNFSVQVTNDCAGPNMVNGTSFNITDSLLGRGNHSINNGISGQEELYFCLLALNSDLTAQSYSTTLGGSWTISVPP